MRPSECIYFFAQVHKQKNTTMNNRIIVSQWCEPASGIGARGQTLAASMQDALPMGPTLPGGVGLTEM